MPRHTIEDILEIIDVATEPPMEKQLAIDLLEQLIADLKDRVEVLKQEIQNQEQEEGEHDGC